MTFEKEFFDYLQSATNLTFVPEHIPQASSLPAAIYTVESTDYEYNQSGYAGVATKHYKIQVVSTDCDDIYNYAETIRLTIQGFRGVVPGGSTQILSCLLDGMQTESAQPDDSSDVWLFWSDLDYSVKYRESIGITSP